MNGVLPIGQLMTCLLKQKKPSLDHSFIVLILSFADLESVRQLLKIAPQFIISGATFLNNTVKMCLEFGNTLYFSTTHQPIKKATFHIQNKKIMSVRKQEKVHH